MERPQECVLGDVLGVVGADEPRGEAHGRVVVALDERAERRNIARGGARHEHRLG
jgi:hypothetical protein